MIDINKSAFLAFEHRLWDTRKQMIKVVDAESLIESSYQHQKPSIADFPLRQVAQVVQRLVSQGWFDPTFCHKAKTTRPWFSATDEKSHSRNYATMNIGVSEEQ